MRKKCPQCGRTVNTSTNRFGDLVYNRHNMAKMYGERGTMPPEVRDDYRPGYDADRATLAEMPCPMSGQVVE